MPKIIENVRGRLIEEAKNQIAENGYDSVTIRSIARGCGLGVGTFYNYFKSKDILIATFLLDEWKERMGRIAQSSDNENDPMAVVRVIYDEIVQFIDGNSSIFGSRSAVKSFYDNLDHKHRVLRSQVAKPICTVCTANGYENAVFLSEFIAEAILTWTVTRKEYSELESIIKKLFTK